MCQKAADRTYAPPATWVAFWLDSARCAAHSIPVDETDRRDIEATLTGETNAYEGLVRRYQQQIAKRMWRFTRDPGELEELVHDVFVEAYISLSSFRAEAPFIHWLNRIATRVGYRLWRARRRDQRTVPLGDWDRIAASGADELEATEAAKLLHELLAQLRPRDRLVLTLRYIDQLSVADTALQAGWSRAMVKVQTHRALKRVRTLLQQGESAKIQSHWERES